MSLDQFFREIDANKARPQDEVPQAAVGFPAPTADVAKVVREMDKVTRKAMADSVAEVFGRPSIGVDVAPGKDRTTVSLLAPDGSPTAFMRDIAATTAAIRDLGDPPTDHEEIADAIEQTGLDPSAPVVPDWQVNEVAMHAGDVVVLCNVPKDKCWVEFMVVGSDRPINRVLKNDPKLKRMPQDARGDWRRDPVAFARQLWPNLKLLPAQEEMIRNCFGEMDFNWWSHSVIELEHPKVEKPYANLRAEIWDSVMKGPVVMPAGMKTYGVPRMKPVLDALGKEDWATQMRFGRDVAERFANAIVEKAKLLGLTKFNDLVFEARKAAEDALKALTVEQPDLVPRIEPEVRQQGVACKRMHGQAVPEMRSCEGLGNARVMWGFAPGQLRIDKVRDTVADEGYRNICVEFSTVVPLMVESMRRPMDLFCGEGWQVESVSVGRDPDALDALCMAMGVPPKVFTGKSDDELSTAIRDREQALMEREEKQRRRYREVIVKATRDRMAALKTGLFEDPKEIVYDFVADPPRTNDPKFKGELTRGYHNVVWIGKGSGKEMLGVQRFCPGPNGWVEFLVSDLRRDLRPEDPEAPGRAYVRRLRCPVRHSHDRKMDEGAAERWHDELRGQWSFIDFNRTSDLIQADFDRWQQTIIHDGKDGRCPVVKVEQVPKTLFIADEAKGIEDHHPNAMALSNWAKSKGMKVGVVHINADGSTGKGFARKDLPVTACGASVVKEFETTMEPGQEAIEVPDWVVGAAKAAGCSCKARDRKACTTFVAGLDESKCVCGHMKECHG